jgi:signal transduction histidine kinase
VNWAGNPDKPVNLENGMARLHPRKSFELWKEAVTLHSKSWRPCEVAAVTELRKTFRNAIAGEHEYRALEQKVRERTAELNKANTELDEEAAERKILEGQLVQAQKLESIGQLAAGIAHEVNTPIQYIGDNCLFLKNSFAELHQVLGWHIQLRDLAKSVSGDGELAGQLERCLADVDTDFLMTEIPKAIEQSLEGVERVAGIVSAMKEFSHPGSEEKAPVDLNRAIQNTLAVCRNEVKYAAKVFTDLDPLLPQVHCLAGEINQVILNLVVNAAHAIGSSRSGSRRTGELGTINVSTRLDGAFVEIRVQDDGGGVRESIRHRIFDPFFTTKEVGKGTGQGLAIARNAIVKKHGGTLTFQTEENVGTTFIVRIPVEPAPEPPL